MSTDKFGLLASVLAKNLNDIEDLPEFVTPPPGVYELLIEKVEQTTIGKEDKSAIRVQYVVAKTIELNDPEGDKELVVKDGDKFSEAFWFDNPERVDTTLGVLKAKYGGLSVACGTENLLEIMDKMEGMLVQCKVTNRVDKEDKTKIYAGTRDIVPAT